MTGTFNLLALRLQEHISRFREKAIPQPKGFGIFLVLLILVNSLAIFNRLTSYGIGLSIGFLVVFYLGLWFHIADRVQEAIITFGIAVLTFGILFLEYMGFNLSNYQRLHSLVRLGIVILVVGIQPILLVHMVRSIWKYFELKMDLLVTNDNFSQTKVLGNSWIWAASFLLIVLYFAVANYDRAGIMGWDTPNYAWRSQLLSLQNGISLHLTYYDNGTQVVFSSLVYLFKTIFGFSVWDSIFLLSSILAGVGCIAVGLLVYSATRSNYITLFAIILTASNFPIARFVADLRDNLAAWVFGTLALALLAIGREVGKKRRYEILATFCLVITGFSHIAISVVYFLVVGVISIVWYLDDYEWREIFRKPLVFIKYIQIPLFAVIALFVVFIPFLPSYLSSLQKFGLETEALGTSVFTLNSLLESMEFFSYGGLTIIGVLGLIGNKRNKQQIHGEKIILIWFLIALSLYLFLPGRLQYRYFFMIPLPALAAVGLYVLMEKLKHVHGRVANGMIVIVLFFLCGMLLPYNLAKNYQAVNDRAIWVEKSTLDKVQAINSYINVNSLKPPFVFIINTNTDAMAYSVLWRNTVLSTIDPVYLLSSYVYFGDLQHYLNAEQEFFKKGDLALASDFWWSKLDADKVFDHQPTAFILQSFNPGIFEEYYFDLNVDQVIQGVLVVKPAQ